MKKNITIILTFILLSGVFIKWKYYSPNKLLVNAQKEVQTLADAHQLHNGDIIFQNSLSSQSKAIKLATHSKYTHCGIVYLKGNDYYVLEAVQPVKITDLASFIARGKEGHYVVKRLKNASQILNDSVLYNMKTIGEKLIGKDYDITFEWSDDKIYCSELVWKIYQRGAGVEVGKLATLKEFDLSNELVKRIMRKRYGTNINYEEKVISPAAVFESENLVLVKEN
ncbi:MAG: YiiX family permuted papain-like enzyme [Candidatus Methylacidiphilales bacterium]